MTDIVVTVATTPAPLPTGIVAGLLQINLFDGSNAVVGSQTVGGLTATFSAVSPGTYYANAQRLDSNGNALGAVSPNSDVVTVVLATFDSPSSVAIALA
jgi:hypothetical protein